MWSCHFCLISVQRCDPSSRAAADFASSSRRVLSAAARASETSDSSFSFVSLVEACTRAEASLARSANVSMRLLDSDMTLLPFTTGVPGFALSSCASHEGERAGSGCHPSATNGRPAAAVRSVSRPDRRISRSCDLCRGTAGERPTRLAGRSCSSTSGPEAARRHGQGWSIGRVSEASTPASSSLSRTSQRSSLSSGGRGGCARRGRWGRITRRRGRCRTSPPASVRVRPRRHPQPLCARSRCRST